MEKDDNLEIRTSTLPEKNTIKPLQAVELFKERKPILISQHTQLLTLEKAQKSVQLSTIKREQGEEFTENMVCSVLSEALRLIPNQLNKVDILTYAKMFLQEYRLWKVDDLILCLKEGTNGRYGKVFNVFNYSEFMDWCLKYDQAKTEYWETQQAHDSHKNHARNNETNQSLCEKYQIGKKFFDNE